jgi:hypothetical protein
MTKISNNRSINEIIDNYKSTKIVSFKYSKKKYTIIYINKNNNKIKVYIYN